MEALTTLINVDVEMAPKLVSFIANAIDDSDSASAFRKSCSELIATAQSEALIRKILDHTENILDYDNPADAEGCFQALVSILFTISDADVRLSIVNSMIQSICANNSHPKLRLQVLVTLFNLLTNKKEKLEIVKGTLLLVICLYRSRRFVLILIYGVHDNACTALLKFGSENGMSGIVSQLHENVEGWISAWGLSIEEERALLKLIVDILSQSNQELQSHKFLVRFLHTYGASEEYPPDVLSVAVAAALAAVKSPASAIADRNVVFEVLNSWSAYCKS